ncbi:MAG: flagellar motor switch protein FliN [bacterium]
MSDEDDNKDDVGADWADALEEQASDGADEKVESEVDDAAADWGAALEEQADAKPDAAQADFEELSSENNGDALGDRNLDMILDIPVTLSMEIGRADIAIRNLLQLSQGSVIELEQIAGEPMDVMVNGTLIAHGEVVVVNDRYGIRLTDVISPAERVRKLK